MTYLYEYLLFLAQAATVVIAIVLILSAITAFSMRKQGDSSDKGHLTVEHFNDHLEQIKHKLQQHVLDPHAFKLLMKEQAKEHKKELKKDHKLAQQQAKEKKGKEKKGKEKKDKQGKGGEQQPPAEGGTADKRVYVLDFNGDLQASRLEYLRKEVTAINALATPHDEVVVRLESPGGVVHGYGLAASQLTRFKGAGIPLTVVVDKVAASGGYMMACVANKVLAAPFAVIGSIGVVAQIPNVHRLLKKYDVDVDVLTAGKYKRTLTMLGENTPEGREKFIEELEDTHALFQKFVSDNRPAVDLDKVATGETWYGQEAVDMQLIDDVSTSDEYLIEAAKNADVYLVSWVVEQKPIHKLLSRLDATLKSWINPLGRY